MYVWKVTLNEHWSFHDKGEYDETTLTVATKTGEEAIEKAKKRALAQSYSDEESCTGSAEKCLSVALIGLEMKEELDA